MLHRRDRSFRKGWRCTHLTVITESGACVASRKPTATSLSGLLAAMHTTSHASSLCGLEVRSGHLNPMWDDPLVPICFR